MRRRILTLLILLFLTASAHAEKEPLWSYKTDGIIYSVSMTPNASRIVAAATGEPEVVLRSDNYVLRGRVYLKVPIYMRGNVYLLERNGSLRWKKSVGRRIPDVEIDDGGEQIAVASSPDEITRNLSSVSTPCSII